MLIARMVPYFPSIMLNAIGALSAMRLSDYVIASLIGKFPSTGIEAIIGHDTITKQEDPTRLIVVVVLAILLIAGAWYYEKQGLKRAILSSSSEIMPIACNKIIFNSVFIGFSGSKFVEGDVIKITSFIILLKIFAIDICLIISAVLSSIFKNKVNKLSWTLPHNSLLMGRIAGDNTP